MYILERWITTCNRDVKNLFTIENTLIQIIPPLVTELSFVVLILLFVDVSSLYPKAYEQPLYYKSLTNHNKIDNNVTDSSRTNDFVMEEPVNIFVSNESLSEQQEMIIIKKNRDQNIHSSDSIETQKIYHTDIGMDYISYEDTTVKEVLGRIKRWYNFKYEIQCSILDQHVSVDIVKTNLSDVMQVISILTNCTIEKDSTTIKIIPKQQTSIQILP